MANGDVQSAGKRVSPNPESIAARVSELAKGDTVREGVRVDGVMPLNIGFFRLERMRSQSIAKKRSKLHVKVEAK